MSRSTSTLDPELPTTLLRALLGMPFLAYRSLRWRALRGGWLRDHAHWHRPFDRRALPAGAAIDVMVLVADHYEPARRDGDDAAVESVRSWCAAYEAIASRHADSDGRPPQHTWFYRYDYPHAGCVQALSESTFRGFGEVEFHLHHGHDTHETMVARLQKGVEWFNRFGAMLTAEERPRQAFGYVAGNSALDNGAGQDGLSGCDTEIRALRDAGCYADFTFASLGSPAQPRVTNSIYYATEDGRPKSYNTGVAVQVDRPASGDLMIFQGPTAFDWRHGRIDDGSVENSSPPHPRRLGAWLKANVHVAGRPEWVFIKLHTHAMQNRASFLSRSAMPPSRPWRSGGRGRRFVCTTSRPARPTTSSRPPRLATPATRTTTAIFCCPRPPTVGCTVPRRGDCGVGRLITPVSNCWSLAWPGSSSPAPVCAP